jgi:hypothetical protein
MFQRRPRETRFHIEQLEGRNAPSIVVTSATVPRESDNASFTIHGYTTLPTIPGDRVTFSTSVCCGNNSIFFLRRGKGDATVRPYSLHQSHIRRTGEFTAEISPSYIYAWRYSAGMEVKVVADRVSPDGQKDLTEELVRIKLIEPGR